MSVVTSPNYGFTFGSLNLLGSDADIVANGYKFTVQASDDADFGNPVPIEQAVISWLQDGAIVALQGYDNREMYLKVSVDANDGVGLAQGEAALMLETGKANTLTYMAADPAAAPTVFDVVMSYLEIVTDGSYEKSQTRTYGLRIKALPTTRSQSLVSVTVPAPSGTQSITTVDDCTSFTDWAGAITSPPGSTVTPATGSSGGANFVQGSGFSPVGATFTFKLTRSSLSASITTTPFIRVVVDTFSSPDSMTTPTFTVNGVAAPVAVQEGNVYWIDTTGLGLGSTMTSLVVQTTMRYTTGTAFRSLVVRDVSRSNVLGTQATNRQLGRTVAIAGSARTQGNLAISDASAALGTTLVYTCPTSAGLQQPNLGTSLATGNTRTSDATTVSGFTSDLATLHGFDVPIAGLQPGGHILLARIKHASSGNRTLTWAARSRQGSTDLPDAQSGTTAVTLTAGAYAVVNVAALNLPPRQMGTSGVVRIELTASTGVTLDEAWIFNVDTGRLTWVECGTASPSAGGSANRLWLDAASVQVPVPRVYLGFASDRSDQFHASSEMVSFMQHEFTPVTMNVFTVTTNSTASSVTLSHYPRWMTHAVS